MLQLTKRTEYGLIALIHMADREGEVVSAREIGERYPIPRRLLAEVLKDLGRAGLIESQRGATGGYTLVRAAEDVTLAEIVSVLEGSPAVTNCDGGSHVAGDTCGIAPMCPIRSPLTRIRDGIWGHMQRTTLRSLAQPHAHVAMSAPAPARGGNEPNSLDALDGAARVEPRPRSA